MRLAGLPTDQVRLLPLLAKAPAAWVAITESDLYDWAGMWVNRVATIGEHLVVEQRAVTAADELTLHMARAGGAVASFEPASPAGVN